MRVQHCGNHFEHYFHHQLPKVVYRSLYQKGDMQSVLEVYETGREVWYQEHKFRRPAAMDACAAKNDAACCGGMDGAPRLSHFAQQCKGGNGPHENDDASVGMAATKQHPMLHYDQATAPAKGFTTSHRRAKISLEDINATLESFATRALSEGYDFCYTYSCNIAQATTWGLEYCLNPADILGGTPRLPCCVGTLSAPAPHLRPPPAQTQAEAQAAPLELPSAPRRDHALAAPAPAPASPASWPPRDAHTAAAAAADDDDDDGHLDEAGEAGMDAGAPLEEACHGQPRKQKKDTSIYAISNFFHLPMSAATKQLRIGSTALKKICRRHGIPRWPYRRLRAIEKIIEQLQQTGVLDGADCGEDAQRIRDKIQDLRRERRRLCFQI